MNDASGAAAGQLNEVSALLGKELLSRQWIMSTIESCTGGLIAGALTDIPGSSAWFEQGFVTYSNVAKQRLVGVPEQVLAEHGAVSEACVRAMVEGGLSASSADLAVAVSGIAGPDGATPGKPVGTVWLAWALGDQVSAEKFVFSGNRQSVREQAVLMALRGTILRLQDS